MSTSQDVLIQSAVTLLATGRAKTTTQAVRLAQEMVLEIERLLAGGPTRSAALKKAVRAAPAKAPAAKASATKASATKASATKASATKAPARKAAAAKAPARKAAGGAALLSPRARRVFERLGLVRPDDAELLPRDLRGRICAAHLDGAKACGPGTIKHIAAWFEAHGDSLPAECAAFDANWLTNRCDEAAG